MKHVALCLGLAASLVALTTIALLGSAREARAARSEGVANPVIDPASAVTSLSLVPGAGKAEVIVSISGPVQVQDFTVPSPHRIVLDLTGARLAPRPYFQFRAPYGPPRPCG